MPLGRGQENDFSRRHLALNSNFLPTDKIKIKIQRGRTIVHLMVGLNLRYHFLPLLKMKKICAPDEKVMFQRFRRIKKSMLAFIQTTNSIWWGRESDV
jgi:hypothetical protein